MNKLIISLAFTITLPLFQVAVAQETEITETFLDTEITELQQNVCNNSEVNSILLSNEPYKSALDDDLVKNSNGDYYVKTYYYDDDGDGYEDDDDDDDGFYTTKIVSSTSLDTSIMADPNEPSTQDDLNSACL